MLPAVEEKTPSPEASIERRDFISKLTKCWSDCASVVVIEQTSSVSKSSEWSVSVDGLGQDGWTPYIGAFGSHSWQRLRSEPGRLQTGLHFMLSVAKHDPAAFSVSQLS